MSALVEQRQARGLEHEPVHSDRNRGILVVVVGGAEKVAGSDQLRGRGVAEADVPREHALNHEQAHRERVARGLHGPFARGPLDERRLQLGAGALELVGFEELGDILEGVEDADGSPFHVHRRSNQSA